MRLNKPVVGMAATPSGNGYWLVASDGGIFSYGDASFYGSTGSLVLNKPIVGMITGPGGAGYFLVASDGGIFSFGTAPFYGSLGGLTLKHPIVAAAATPTGNGYWFTDTAGLVSNFGSADYYGSAPSPLFRPIVGMAEAPGSTGAFVGGTYPSGSYGYDISTYQCSSLPGGDHQIGIVQVDGSSSGNTNPCLPAELAWAGSGLNLYTYLTYATSATNEPGCNGDTSCNAGYQAGIFAYNDAFNAGAGSPATPWWLDVETADANWSSNLGENAQFVQGALNALHETEGIADVGIYASPGVWNSIVGDYQPDVPYWMADYLASPSGPGSCADITTVAEEGRPAPHRAARDRAVRQHAVRRRLRLLAAAPLGRPRCAGGLPAGVWTVRSRHGSPLAASTPLCAGHLSAHSQRACLESGEVPGGRLQAHPPPARFQGGVGRQRHLARTPLGE